MAQKYSFSGASNGLNPPIILVRGTTYTFNVTSTGHPLWIKTARTAGTGDAYSTGVTNNGASSGVITFVVSQAAPNLLYYVSQNDVKLSNEIYVVNSTISIIGDTYSQGNNILSGSLTITGSLNITGSQVISGSSNIIGISYVTGSHRISGSLILSGSAFMDGTLMVKTVVAQIITSSTTYDSGSNIFGNLYTDTHQFTGSVLVSGSISVINPVINQLTASYAITASYVNSSSYAMSSSYAVTASHLIGQSPTASYALTSSFVGPIPIGSTETDIVVLNADGRLKYRSDLNLQGPQGPQGTTGIQGPQGTSPSTSTFINNSTDSFTPSAVISYVVTLSQAQYDGIGTKDANTLYIIV